MASNPYDRRRELPSTYYVRDRANQDELNRLNFQDELLTAAMGGPLPEQPGANTFRRILDIGCGTGGWLIEAAKAYPDIKRLFGIDVNAHLIDHAREKAEEAQVSDRVEFLEMDALLLLEFPQGYFDLTNARLITAFMRTWNWPKMLKEMIRVTYPGGVVRLTEVKRVRANSPNVLRMATIFGDGLFNAGHLFAKGRSGDSFTEDTIGIASELEGLLDRYGLHDIQTRPTKIEYRAGTPAGENYLQDIRLFGRTMPPFLRKWGAMPDDYDAMYQQAVEDAGKPDFVGSWDVLTAWGTTTI